MLYLNDASCYIPDDYLTVEQAGELLELNQSNINIYKKIYGIERIPTARKIKPIEFVKRSVQNLLEQNQPILTNLKYLVHCHTAKTMSPFGISLVREVKEQLGCSHTIAFGTSTNNCASAVVMLEMLAQILADDEQAILVCADYAFTRIMQFIPNTSILGDGSAAVLVSKQGERNKLLSITNQIVGKYAKGMWLSAEESKDFENNYISLLADVMLNALQKANLTLSQIKIILPHNVNYPSWRKLAYELNIPLNKIYLENIKKYSHCFGADIFINYLSMMKSQLLSPGDYYMMTTVGLGATFSAMVFQY